MAFLKSVLVALLSAIFLKEIYCKPLDSGDGVVCYSVSCPKGTAGCGKDSETSKDKTQVNIQIICYDDKGSVLESQNFTEPNPYGPSVYYKGTKFSIAIPEFLLETISDEDSENRPVLTVTEPKASSGPKSEVEDLNSR